jgi:Fe-S-cluster containining protein
VWVNEEEIESLAAYLGLARDELERRYVRQLAGGRALLERFDGDCVFLDADTRRCTVYPARPVQCRTWPFWEPNLVDEEAWRRTCDVCPGAGHGPLLSVDQIRRRLQDRVAARSRT